MSADAWRSIRSVLTTLLIGLALSFASICSSPAQDGPTDNPTGVGGDFNGEVTTGGGYDPFTGNAKRTITDLVVPGSNGAYPLAFSRTHNTRFSNPLYWNDTVMGHSAEWRHSYQWSVAPADFNPTHYTINPGAACAYNVAYPDGSVVTYRPRAGTSGYANGRTNIPQAEPYWRGPAGTTDRLEVRSASDLWLHRNDGGLVQLGGTQGTNGQYSSIIVDPYGAVTTLLHNSTVGLYKVIEPGGRFLVFGYTAWKSGKAPNQQQRYWLTSVTASNGQSVTFNYQDVPQGGTFAAIHQFTGVNYVNEGNLQAIYKTSPSPGISFTAIDPHFAGPMSQIQYVYTDDRGYLQEEDNYNTGVKVSSLATSQTVVNGDTVTTCDETRGDVKTDGSAIMRRFVYSEPSTQANQTNAGNTPFLTRMLDYEGGSTTMTYFGSDQVDGNGQGYLATSTDRCGFTTSYGREPILGRVKSVSFSDTNPASLLSTSVWTNYDDDVNNAINPYFLHASTNERNLTTTYWHDSASHMVRQIDYPDNSHEYFYYTGITYNGNTFYKLSCSQNKLGAQVYYSYDEAGHGGTGFKGLLTSMTRFYADGYGHTSPGEVTQLYYDAYDRVSQTVDPLGVVTSFTYNGRHQVLTVLHGNGSGGGGDGSVIYYAYDSYGRRTDVWDELGHNTHTVYDEYGRPTSVTQAVDTANGVSRTMRMTYDGRGTGNQLIAPALTHTDGRFSYQVMPSGRGVQRIYSANGWLREEYSGQTAGDPNAEGSLYFTQVLHDKQNIVYDAMGRQGTVTDAQGHTWTTPYDARSRPLGQYDPLNNVVFYNTYNYSGPNAGLLQSKVSSGNNSGGTLTTTYTAYDNMGRPTAWTDPAGNSYSSGYDPAGNLASQSDGMSTASPPHPATVYSYDGLGRKVGTAYADGTGERWHYDAGGNVSSYTNRANNTQTLDAYDSRHRPTQWHWSDASLTFASAVSYDAAGRCNYMTNNQVALNMAYDDTGALKSEQTYFGADGTSRTIGYKPDMDGNVGTITYPSGHVATLSDPSRNELDYLGRLQAVDFTFVGNPISRLATYGYTGELLTSRSTYSNMTTQYVYQANNRISAVDQYNAGMHAGIVHQTFGYYPDGQTSWMLRNADASSGNALNDGKGDAYYYRLDGKLFKMLYDAQGVYSSTNFDQNNPANPSPTNMQRTDNFAYNPAGGRTMANEGGAVRTVSFDAENRQIGLGYDANGNTTTLPYNGSTYSYAYDAMNQLVAASGGPHTASFLYDPKGRLCQRTVDGTTTRLFYAGDRVLEEQSGSNQPQYIYLYGAGGERVIRVRASDYYGWCYHYDARGWLTHVTNGSLTVSEQYQYDAFGLPRIYDGSGTQSRGQTSQLEGTNRFLWNAGYEWYPEIGLYRCGARFYSPTQARFMQPDPIGQKGGLNIYRYCGNDPINESDPSGLADFIYSFPRYAIGADGNVVDLSQTPGASHYEGVGGTGSVSGSGNEPSQPTFNTGSGPLQSLSSGGSGTGGSVSGVGGTLFSSSGTGFGRSVANVGGGGYEAIGDTLQGLKSFVMSVYKDPTGLRGLSNDFKTLYAMGSDPSATWLAVKADVVDNFKDASSTQHALGYIGTLMILDVASETQLSNGNVLSKFKLNAVDALTDGERFLGPGYREIGKTGSGVFRSKDGLRQFRMDTNSLQGNHNPFVPHVHFELYAPGAAKPYVNNHVPINP